MATCFRFIPAITVTAAGSKFINRLTTLWVNTFSSTGTLTGE